MRSKSGELHISEKVNRETRTKCAHRFLFPLSHEFPSRLEEIKKSELKTSSKLNRIQTIQLKCFVQIVSIALHTRTNGIFRQKQWKKNRFFFIHFDVSNIHVLFPNWEHRHHIIWCSKFTFSSTTKFIRSADFREWEKLISVFCTKNWNQFRWKFNSYFYLFECACDLFDFVSIQLNWINRKQYIDYCVTASSFSPWFFWRQKYFLCSKRKEWNRCSNKRGRNQWKFVFSSQFSPFLLHSEIVFVVFVGICVLTHWYINRNRYR